jgi:hypothetical protein
MYCFKGLVKRLGALGVACEPCPRRERYEVEGLIRQYGADAKAP